MANTILIKRSSTANTVPSAASLAQGELAINLTDGNLFYKNASDQVTVIASNKFLSVTGNVTGANINGAHFGSGAGLSSLTGANVTGTVPAATTATTAGTVTTAAQGNITSVGTLTSLSVSGNIVGGNISTAGNVTGAFILGNISQATGYSSNKIFNGTSNVDIASTNGSIALNVGGALIGTVSATGVAVTGIVSATGNVTGANINGAHFGSGAGLSSLTGANVTGTVPAATVAATVTTAAQPNITSVGTLTVLSVGTGNITGGNLLLSGAIIDSAQLDIQTSAGNANIVLAPNGTGNVNVTTGLSVTGNISGGNISGTNIVGTLATASQTNITAVGTLGSLAVTGNVTGGNFVGTLNGSGANVSSISATNISSGTLAQARLANSAVTLGSTALTLGATVTTIAGLSSVTSTTFVGALTGAATTAGTVTNAAQGNITSVGTLTSLAVTGNVAGGNLTTTGQVSASGNITGGNVVTNTVAGTGLTLSSSGSLNLSATGNVVVNNVVINGLATPAQNSDAANKGYVDSVAQGLDVKASVVFATTAALPAFTYNNGASGVGATITANANGALSIDGSSPVAGDRVLIKNEISTNQPFNGIYVVTNAGSVGAPFVLTRATDFDNGSPSGEIPGAFTFVEHGSTLADTGFVCTTNAPVTVGTTNIVWTQFSGAGTYTAGTGLTLTGSAFSVNASQTQITSVGTLGSLAVTGTATAGNLSTGGTASATGNVTGGNINTGGLVSATGAVIGGSLSTAGTASATGNVTGGNINTGGLVSATGAVIGGSVSATGNVTGGNITTAGIGSIATLSVGTFANITATTVATSAITGALRVAGGVGVVGNIYGGAVYSGGALALTVDSTVDGGTY
jgi:hypothetical protein